MSVGTGVHRGSEFDCFVISVILRMSAVPPIATLAAGAKALGVKVRALFDEPARFRKRAG